MPNAEGSKSLGNFEQATRVCMWRLANRVETLAWLVGTDHLKEACEDAFLIQPLWFIYELVADIGKIFKPIFLKICALTFFLARSVFFIDRELYSVCGAIVVLWADVCSYGNLPRSCTFITPLQRN